MRPTILENDAPHILKVFVLSYPNFCEAIIGIILTTIVFIYITKNYNIKPIIIYTVASIFTGVYVVLQELKIHNLGGFNIYDPYDVIFSIVGVFVGFILLLKAKPRFLGN